MKGKHILFTLVLAGLGLLLVWFVVELGLRWKERRMASSNRMDPGLYKYDARLGWELNPGWVGEHRHRD